MTDKRLFVILVLLAVYVIGVKPALERLPFKVAMLKNLRKEIYEERFIRKRSEDIEKVFPKYIKIDKQNKKLFFSSSISVSAAMSSMQAFVKKASLHSGMQLIRVNWGSKEDRKGYEVLPISFTVKGYPSQLRTFLKELVKFQKLVKFESVSISASAFSSKLSLTAIIKCYKLKREHQ